MVSILASVFGLFFLIDYFGTTLLRFDWQPYFLSRQIGDSILAERIIGAPCGGCLLCRYAGRAASLAR